MNTTEWTSSELKAWLKNHLALMEKLPTSRLNYTNESPSHFGELGGKLVDHLALVGPVCSDMLDHIISPHHQSLLLKTGYAEVARRHVLAGTGMGPKGKPGYYLTNRRFSKLIPEVYKRSDKAPRLTSMTSNALHGMKKDFQVLNLQVFSHLYPQYFTLEVDLSACHSRIACFLLAKENNPLEQALKKEDEFWYNEARVYLPWFQEVNPLADLETVKGIIKIYLYTSLNGGNPSSPDRVRDALNNKAPHLLLHNPEEVFKVATRVAVAWPLTKAVKDVNKRSFTTSKTNANQVLVHTVAQTEPYVLTKDKSYCGISRVLQSFEVVMLSILTGFCVDNHLIVMSLDHDGLFAMGRTDSDLSELDFKSVMNEYELLLSTLMAPWTTFLLKDPVPVTIKRLICNGKVYKK